MFEMTPVMYLEWLLNSGKYKEQEAITHVEKLYKRQHGVNIKIFQKPYRGFLIWDYEYDESI